MTLNDAIGYIQELCDAINDQPCGCEACPYCDTVDNNVKCIVINSIQSVSEVVKNDTC